MRTGYCSLVCLSPEKHMSDNRRLLKTSRTSSRKRGPTTRRARQRARAVREVGGPPTSPSPIEALDVPEKRSVQRRLSQSSPTSMPRTMRTRSCQTPPLTWTRTSSRASLQSRTRTRPLTALMLTASPGFHPS